jgi:PP-loop superfamily ATP-utilizing enzyme
MIPRALAQRDEIVAAVRAAGYTHVTIDLEGLRHGSMNEGFVKHG